MIIKPNVEDIVKYLKSGLVVAIPTATVYGLAVSYDNIDAINRLNEIKMRDANKIYTMMLSDPQSISDYAIINDESAKIIAKHFPGELTIILPKNKSFKNVYFESQDTIGIRIPNHKLMLDVLKLSGPLLVSSANVSGESPCINSDEVLDRVDADIIVEGASDNALPSTIVRIIDNNIEILRQGDIII